MATLNINTSINDLMSFYSGTDVTDDISQAYVAVGESFDAASTAFEAGEFMTGTLSFDGTTYDQTVYTSDPNGPVMTLSVTGSGFSLSPDPDDAANGLIDSEDSDFTINSFDMRLMGSSASDSELAGVSFAGELVVSGGDLVSGQLTSLSATMDNGGEISFTGPMTYNGVTVTGNNVVVELKADMNPAAGTPVLGKIKLIADLNMYTASDTNTSIIKSIHFDDEYSNHHLALSDLALSWANAEAAQSFDDLVNRAGQSGSNDTVNSSASVSLLPSFENLNLTGTAAINGTGNDLNNILTGNSAANILSGGIGNDRLVGNAGNDTLSGGSGIDTMLGGAGNDTYVVDNAGDVTTELAGQGVDTVNANITHTLKANVENLVLAGTVNRNGTGNNLNNTLTGNSAANALYGLVGSDKLLGGSGNDILVGGLGNDTLTGGVGADKFRFVFASEGMDSITDFSRPQADKLMFVSPNFGSLPVGALVATRFRSNATGSAFDADDRFMFNTTSKILSYDADGNGAGAAVQIAKLTNGANLMASDIQIAAS